jgi:PAS domain S-box-containing protein
MLQWSRVQIQTLAGAVACASLIVAWLANEPSFLPVAILAMTLAFGWPGGLVLAVAIAALLAITYEALGLELSRALAIAAACLASWAVTAFLQAVGARGAATMTDEERWAREADRLLNEVMDAVPAQIWRADRSGMPNYVNKTLFAWSGVGVEHMNSSDRLTSAIDQVIHPEHQQAVADGLQKSFQTGVEFALKYLQRHRSGDYRWVDGRAMPKKSADGQIEAWYGVCLDIDDEMRANEKLAKSALELRQIVDTVPAFIWLLTPEGKSYYYNKQGADWVGISIEELDALDIDNRDLKLGSLIHPDDREQAYALIAAGLAAGEPMQLRARMRRKDGEYRWLSSRISPLRDENGAIVRWYGVSFDIEDEMRAAEALRNSKRHLQQVIDTVPAMIFRANPQGEPVYTSKRMLEMHGIDFGKFDDPLSTDATLDILVHADDRSEVLADLQHSFSTGEPFRKRYRQLRVDGSFGWIEGRMEPLRDEDGEIIEWYGVNLDIDDEVRAQENLRSAQEKLARASHAASMAELSASIAHEVNQPLAAIVANAQACMRWLSREQPPFTKARETAAEMIRNAEVASEVVYRIRSLFKPSGGARSPAGLNDVVLEVSRLMKGEFLQGGGRVETVLANGLPLVPMDRVQIQQVLVNLMRNGLQAMEDLPDRERILQVRSALSGEDVIVEIIDSGPGIADASGIFEPFFTTKRDGLGMGLAICRSIVESHGGQLQVSSVPGRTVFSFTLPLEPQEAAAAI